MNKDDLTKLAEALEGMGIEHSYSQQVLDDEDMGALFDHIKLAEQGGRPHRLRYALLGYRAAMEQQRTPPVKTGPKDWPEDFHHENGRYMCRCMTCEQRFYGYKRRVVCRECSVQSMEANIQALQGRVEELEALGTVYVAPDNWNSAKAGGPTPIEDYEEIYLPDYGKP